MASYRLNRIPFAVVSAIVVMVFLGYVVGGASSFFLNTVIKNSRSMTAANFAIHQQPYLMASFILRVIGFSSPILAGIVAGWILQRRGWFWAGIAMVIYFLLSIVIVAITFIPRGSSTQVFQNEVSITQNYAAIQLHAAPYVIIAAAIGGVLGEIFYKTRNKHVVP